jgi:hypothetical protein
LALDAPPKDKQQRIAQVLHTLGVAVRLAAQSGKVAAKSVVHALNGVGVRFAFEVLAFVEDVVVALVLVRGVSD